MSSRIAIFHHSRVSGGEPCIQFDHAITVVAEQILALNQGYAAAATEIYFGINGGAEDAAAVEALLSGFDWFPKVKVIAHPDGAKGEHPTLHTMQKWLPEHRDWIVTYHHSKGATQPGNDFWKRWRHCLQGGVIDRWQECRDHLESGRAEACGSHWLTPERYPGTVNSPFFGGNFWTATAEFLLTLPLIEPTAKDRPAFYDAESLIGRGPRPPRIIDFHPEWPGGNCR